VAVIVMTDGHETPGGEPPRRSEGDLLAERRARRAADTGEAALTRRAEAAEATVETLERHVASLQQRLREGEDERRAMAELVEAEQALAHEREHELRRAKQREYAEQQLRVEAEDRMISLDRDSRAEIERLSSRLGSSEDGARALAERLESVQRQLAEAEQAAAAERAAIRRSERELQVRLSELVRRAEEIQRGLEAERAARERSERLLESMRVGHRQIEAIVGDMKGIVARLLAACSAVSSRPEPPPATAAVPEARAPTALAGELLVGEPAALQAPPPPPQVHEGRSPVPPGHDATVVEAEARGAEMADALADAVERLRQRAEAGATVPEGSPVARVGTAPHKHSMSLIKRWRIRRKQRRAR
jgi:hypothetical protein